MRHISRSFGGQQERSPRARHPHRLSVMRPHHCVSHGVSCSILRDASCSAAFFIHDSYPPLEIARRYLSVRAAPSATFSTSSTRLIALSAETMLWWIVIVVWFKSSNSLSFCCVAWRALSSCAIRSGHAESHKEDPVSWEGPIPQSGMLS